MRLTLASLFVFGGLLLAICLLGPRFDHAPQYGGILMGAVMGGLVVFLVIIALFLFNWPLSKGKDGGDPDKYIEDLENKGLLVSTSYQATRAFQLEEFEDEGSHYFVELADGTVLYVTGQYLYDYEPIDDDPELNQTRRFPCSEFSLRSHVDEKFTIDIVCRGLVIEPEYTERHPKDFWKKELEDNEIITNLSYEEIKAKFVNDGKHN